MNFLYKLEINLNTTCYIKQVLILLYKKVGFFIKKSPFCVQNNNGLRVRFEMQTDKIVEGKLTHEQFDLESHVKTFRNNPKFNISKLHGIHDILTSSEYSQFLNSVYEFFSTSPQFQDNSLICQYQNVSEVIDDFWKDLLGLDFIGKFCSKF